MCLKRGTQEIWHSNNIKPVINFHGFINLNYMFKQKCDAQSTCCILNQMLGLCFFLILDKGAVAETSILRNGGSLVGSLLAKLVSHSS